MLFRSVISLHIPSLSLSARRAFFFSCWIDPKSNFRVFWWRSLGLSPPNGLCHEQNSVSIKGTHRIFFVWRFEPNLRSASQLNSFEKKGSSNCQTKSTEDTLLHVTNFLSFSVFFSKTDWQLISGDWQSRCLCCWRSLPLRLSSSLRKRHKQIHPHEEDRRGFVTVI